MLRTPYRRRKHTSHKQINQHKSVPRRFVPRLFALFHIRAKSFPWSSDTVLNTHKTAFSAVRYPPRQQSHMLVLYRPSGSLQIRRTLSYGRSYLTVQYLSREFSQDLGQVSSRQALPLAVSTHASYELHKSLQVVSCDAHTIWLLPYLLSRKQGRRHVHLMIPTLDKSEFRLA